MRNCYFHFSRVFLQDVSYKEFDRLMTVLFAKTRSEEKYVSWLPFCYVVSLTVTQPRLKFGVAECLIH